MEHIFDCMIGIEIRKCWNDDTLFQCLILERFALEVAKSFFWSYSYWSPSEKCYENGRLNDTLKLIPNGDATLIFFLHCRCFSTRTHPEDPVVMNILRQRTNDVEVKKYCVDVLHKLGSFVYTKQVMPGLNEPL